MDHASTPAYYSRHIDHLHQLIQQAWPTQISGVSAESFIRNRYHCVSSTILQSP